MIPYGTCVPVAVRLLANCYTPFTFYLTYIAAGWLELERLVRGPQCKSSDLQPNCRITQNGAFIELRFLQITPVADPVMGVEANGYQKWQNVFEANKITSSVPVHPTVCLSCPVSTAVMTN